MADQEKQLLAIDPTTVCPGKVMGRDNYAIEDLPVAKDRQGRWYFCRGLVTERLNPYNKSTGQLEWVQPGTNLLDRAKAAYDKMYQDPRGRVVLGLAAEVVGLGMTGDLRYPPDNLGIWVLIGEEDGLESAAARVESDGGADFMYMDIKKIRAGEEQGSKDVAASYEASARGPWGCQVRGCEPEHRRW
ncbi:hypothetical protein A2617_01590 [Candidatus Daviesbacteria bacterium RIFOXYD1_FULL_41_10]|uniref:Uncharacterized protein n=2 Tax=Candidatus Daviesiibacteriota TaxID=1752718 RepID=A0A1F5MZE6_9BACT|nr:MAG: hypothetical protein UU67_C0022G0017 [Candidatus Daviesbacteria bacterium GW2011_GWB1_41_5]OGE70758.1 MAG: hypothetical protein A2617_01590 [Candidatus Daviesbacteria bacterium RIFOXYD1_FULL_41_10]